MEGQNKVLKKEWGLNQRMLTYELLRKKQTNKNKMIEHENFTTTFSIYSGNCLVLLIVDYISDNIEAFCEVSGLINLSI